MRFRIDPTSAVSKNIDLRSKFLKPLYLLSGIGALILLVVCINLADTSGSFMHENREASETPAVK